MSAAPIASYLADFGADAAAALRARAGREAAPSASEISAGLEAAHASGLESGKAAARAELERKLEAQAAAYDARLTEARRTWASEEAGKLAQRLTLALQEIEGRIGDAVARILQPFLAAELRRAAVADLRAELDTLLARDGAIKLTVSGPEDLLQGLRQHLAGTVESGVTYLPDEGVELRVEAGQTVLETRLGAWLGKIQEAMP